MNAIKTALAQARKVGPILMTADTYIVLVHHAEVIVPEEVAVVFPWVADQHCVWIPEVLPHVDAICRSAALFYYSMFNRVLINGGNPVRYIHTAANTVSYRARAGYQTLKREQRNTIRPHNPNEKVLQFDWRAAEWSLILQESGYDLPVDPYEVFTTNKIGRESAKGVVLASIYGASRDKLCEGRDPIEVDAVITQIERDYPNVLAWAERLKRTTTAVFEGFTIDMADLVSDAWKRPNRWAQTALQLCKWDLIHRIVSVGGHRLAAGDMHDSLVFHVDPVADMALARSVVAEIEKPCFGRYRLKPQFKGGEHWE